MNKTRLVTPPLVEPVTLAEMKAYAKIDDANDDALLEALLRGARQWCEHFTRRAFIAQSWAVYVSDAPKQNYVELPRGPLLSVTRVQLADEQGEYHDLPTSNFLADGEIMPPQLFLADDASWPAFDRAVNSLRIEYVAGYGETAASVPEPIKIAIMQLTLHWHEHRGEAIVGQSVVAAPLTIEALLLPYRVFSMGGA